MYGPPMSDALDGMTTRDVTPELSAFDIVYGEYNKSGLRGLRRSEFVGRADARKLRCEYSHRVITADEVRFVASLCQDSNYIMFSYCAFERGALESIVRSIEYSLRSFPDMPYRIAFDNCCVYDRQDESLDINNVFSDYMKTIIRAFLGCTGIFLYSSRRYTFDTELWNLRAVGISMRIPVIIHLEEAVCDPVKYRTVPSPNLVNVPQNKLSPSLFEIESSISTTFPRSGRFPENSPYLTTVARGVVSEAELADTASAWGLCTFKNIVISTQNITRIVEAMRGYEDLVKLRSCVSMDDDCVSVSISLHSLAGQRKMKDFSCISLTPSNDEIYCPCH